MPELSGLPEKDFWLLAGDGTYKVPTSVVSELLNAGVFIPDGAHDSYAKLFRSLHVLHASLEPENTTKWRVRISIRKNDISFFVTTVRDTPRDCFRHITKWIAHI